MFNDYDIFDSMNEEINERSRNIKRWGLRSEQNYPHPDYDYSTDDLNDYEYLQDIT